MTLTFAAELVLRSSALLGGAWLAAVILHARGASAATRHAVWMLGFATLISLPLLAWILPPLQLPVLPENPTDPSLTIGVPVGYAPAASSASGQDPILLIYLAVATLLLARLALGRMLLERMWRRAEPMDHWRREIRRTSSLLGIGRPVEVRASAQDVVPMTWGSLRPRILLPREALDWSPDRRHSVLLHEFGHVSRNDSLGTLIAQAVCALYWPNPLAWHALGQMRLAQEQASDDLVLSNGTAATSYARDLLDSVSTVSPRLATAAVGMSGRNDLELRLRAILGAGSRRRPSGSFVGSAAIAAAVGGVLVATVIPVAAQSAARTGAEAAAVPFVRFAEPIVPESPTPPGPPKHTAQVVRGEERSAHTVSSPSVLPVTEAPAIGQSDAYALQLAEYRRQKMAYSADLERYRAELEVYRAAREEYRQKVAAFRQRMVELGPHPPTGVTIPTAPVAPVAPVAPTAPVVPPVPPQPHST